MKYQDDVRSAFTKIAEANADLIGGNAEAQPRTSAFRMRILRIRKPFKTTMRIQPRQHERILTRAVADFGKAVGKSLESSEKFVAVA
jgi:hypothetical protein